MKRHQINSWEKEWDFQPNLQRAKDDWLDPVTPTYACPPRDGRSERRNAARARQDAALGVSLTKDPAWKRKFIPTYERNALKKTYPHRTDPVVGNSTNHSVMVKKSVYTPHGGRQASSPPRGHSHNGSYPRGRSAPRGGGGGLVYDGSGGEGALQMAQEEREFGNHPPQSMERMYRETVRNRRNEHLRNGDHVEPEWEHQRGIMDVVGAKSAEDLIDGGYDSRYRQPGTMLDVRRDRRVMSQNDRSSMAYRMFPENYKRLQGHDYDESTFGRDEGTSRHRTASSRRAASAHNSRAATNEAPLSRSTSSRQGRHNQQQEDDLQRGNRRWEEEQGRSAYHALGNTTTTAQPAHRRAPSKRVISGFHDDREEQDAKMRRDQLDAADQRTRMINQSYDQANAPHLSDVVSPTRNRYGGNTRGRGDNNNNSTSYNRGNSSFVNNIRSTTANHIDMPAYSSPLRGGMDQPNRSSSSHRHNNTHTSSMRTPYSGADLSTSAASFYGDRLAAHKPFTYPATPYQEVWGSSQAPPSHHYQVPPASESFVAHSYDRFADVVSRFGPNSPMRGAENSYYPHQAAAQPTMQTRSSYFQGDTGPIVVTTSAPTVLHSSIPRAMPSTMATPHRNTTIGPLQPPMPMPVGSGSPNGGGPSVYCATGHFYMGGEGGSPPRGVSFVEPVSMVVSHNMPSPQINHHQQGTSLLQESSALSPNRRY